MVDNTNYRTDGLPPSQNPDGTVHPGSGGWVGRDALEMRRSDYRRYGTGGIGMPTRAERRNPSRYGD